VLDQRVIEDEKIGKAAVLFHGGGRGRRLGAMTVSLTKERPREIRRTSALCQAHRIGAAASAYRRISSLAHHFIGPSVSVHR
jgi:hypothetical protein